MLVCLDMDGERVHEEEISWEGGEGGNLFLEVGTGLERLERSVESGEGVELHFEVLSFVLISLSELLWRSKVKVAFWLRLEV